MVGPGEHGGEHAGPLDARRGGTGAAPLDHPHEWGDWGTSFDVEPGHQVRFKAFTLDGEEVVSR